MRRRYQPLWIYATHRHLVESLRLTKTGRKIFAARHGRPTALPLLSEKIGGHTISSTKTIKITPVKPKHKK